MEELFTNFSMHSGLQINAAKSRVLFSKGVPRRKKEKISSLTGIWETASFDKYLGFPMLKDRAKKENFYFVIDKIQNRLASWKLKLLNKAGRMTLDKSVLTSIPIYYMQVNWLPMSVCNRMDQITRNFIWKGSSEKGVNLVGWEKISQPKRLGGLGVRMARETNTVTLGKLVWDLHYRMDKLWVQMLTMNHMKDGSFLNSSCSSGSPIWNSIFKAKEVLKEGF